MSEMDYLEYVLLYSNPDQFSNICNLVAHWVMALGYDSGKPVWVAIPALSVVFLEKHLQDSMVWSE